MLACAAQVAELQDLARPCTHARAAQTRVSAQRVFVSGVSSRRKDGSFRGAEQDEMGNVNLDIKEQTRAVIENISDILKSEGSSLEDVVDLTTFLINMNDFKGYNETYAEYFTEGGPARTTVAAHQLPHPLILIEIKVTAFVTS